LGDEIYKERVFLEDKIYLKKMDIMNSYIYLQIQEERKWMRGRSL